MRKIVLYIFVIGLVFFVNDSFVNAAEYITPKQVEKSPKSITPLKRVLDTYDPYVLNPSGEFSTFTYKGVKLDLKFGEYNNNGFVSFGYPNQVTSASGQLNDRKGSEYRFLGMSNDGYTPVTNFEFPDDIPTDGNTIGRSYVTYPWTKRDNLTNSFRPGLGVYNLPSRVRFAILEKRKTDGLLTKNPTDADAQKLIDTWLKGLYDRYQRDHAYYKRTSKFWARSSSRTSNEFQKMSPSKLRNIAYIAMPPTMYTYGVANTYYKCGSVSASGYCYDVHWIDPISTHKSPVKPNLVASSVKARATSPIYYEVTFSAKNVANTNLMANVYSQGKYRIGGGAWKSLATPMAAVRHGSDWTKNKVNGALMGGIYVPPGTPVGTRIDVEVEINPVRGGSREVDEGSGNYGDNIKRMTLYTEEISMCMTGGAGTSQSYGSPYCSSVGTLPDGTRYCMSTSCSYSTYTLSNTAMIDYEKTKQTLLGMWSKNRSAHTDKDVPEARDADLKSDQFSIKMGGDFAKQLKKMGVEPTRTIRAGRSVQMYGTIEVELNLSSFNGVSDLESKKNRFMSNIINTLKTQGIQVDGNDAVKNNKGSTRTSVMLDTNRTSTKINGTVYTFGNKPEGYMYKYVSPTTTNTYGSSYCRQIVVTSRTYKFVIPVKSKSDGGKQNTSQGDFVSAKSYNVDDQTADFVTNINNKNGDYGLQFTLGMDRGALDSSFSGSQLCKSSSETFRIDGNIFDDVRSEDQTDEIDEDRENWDFK